MNTYLLVIGIFSSMVCIKFWLITCVSVCHEDEEHSLQLRLQIYRCVNLLRNLYNIVFGNIIIPCAKTITIISFVASLSTIIRYGTNLNLVTYVLFWIILVATIAVTIPMSLETSSWYKYSNQFRSKITKEASIISDSNIRHVLQKEVKATFGIRCRIGQFYYMEAKAKLTLADSLIHGVAFLLLSFD